MQENINIPDSTITTNLSFRQLILMNMQQLTNFPYIEKDFDALTDYELLSLVVKYLNDVIANQNEQNASITRMYQSFLALQTYVNNTKDTLEDAFNNLDNYVRNYFANLDVQDEINNKLDQMLEDGVLTEIIQQFLQSTAIWCFDNVADMKQATNLINGSFAKTLGYYSVNDGGGATYKITNTSSDTDYQEEVGELYATLIIDKNTTVDCFGAYGDDTHDDITAFTNMISKCGTIRTNNKTYLISESISLSFDCDIKGKIHYTGNNYAFIVRSGSYKKININQIESSGGGILFQPLNNDYISYFDIYLKYAICTNETIKCDATNGVITLLKFDGIRWRSSTNGLIILNIGDNAVQNTFLTEINFHNISFWTQNDLKGIVAVNRSTQWGMQFSLYNVNLENCQGITTTGKIETLNIVNCRTAEIVYRTGWLTFNGYLPQTIIHGNGYIYPEKITMNNISDVASGNNNYIETNMSIVDSYSSYLYNNGGLMYYDHIVPTEKRQVYKNLTSSIENDHYITYAPNKNGNIYNYFEITSSTWLQFTIPKQSILQEFYLKINGTFSLTLTNGSGTKSISASDGIYHIEQTGNTINYTKLD